MRYRGRDGMQGLLGSLEQRSGTSAAVIHPAGVEKLKEEGAELHQP